MAWDDASSLIAIFFWIMLKTTNTVPIRPHQVWYIAIFFWIMLCLQDLERPAEGRYEIAIFFWIMLDTIVR